MRLLESVRKIVSSHLNPEELPEGREAVGADRGPARPGDASRRGPSKIVLQAPQRLEQTEEIVDLLQSGSSVVLNLQGGSYETARRLLDFVAGVAYHNANKVWKVARNTFLIVPYDAEVQAAGFPKYGSFGASDFPPSAGVPHGRSGTRQWTS